MKSVQFVFVILTFSLFLSLCITHAKSNSVAVTLNSDNIDKFVSQFDAVFLMIHADWCGYCKKAMPDFDALSGMMVEHYKNGKLLIAKLSGPDNKGITSKYKVKGYPTFVLIKKSSAHILYEKARNIKQYVVFLKESVPSLNESTKNKKLPSKNDSHRDL